MRKLRLNIDGDWTAGDFADFFDEIELVGGLALGSTLEELDRYSHKINVSDQGASWTRLVDDRINNFSVIRIRFGSPGTIDLFGVAKCVEQLRLLIVFLIEFVAKRNDRDLDREEKKLLLISKKLEIIEKGQALGLDDNVYSLLTDQTSGSIFSAVAYGRLTGVKALDSEEKD